jgi:hypothetical protein
MVNLKRILSNFSIYGKRKYIDWDKYKAKVDFLDEFNWQQRIRKRNISNLSRRKFLT